MELCTISHVVRQGRPRALKFGPGQHRLPPMTEATVLVRSTSFPRENERLAAAIAHGGTCVAWFLAPLIIYFIERDRSSFASRHALQALLWSAVGTLVSVATCGLAIPLFLAFHIVAAIRAYEGQDYTYPIIGDLL